MSTRKSARKGLKALACAVIAASTPVIAQPMLEEVVVTAQKREQNLQDVPVSVAAFSGEFLQESQIRDIFDLQTSTPGLVVDQNQNATTSNFAVRGIGTGGTNFGFESAVGLYVDGVFRSQQSSMISQLVDIQSVDVLRGPQGTLFGRNTLSGAIQFTTVRPDHEGTGFAEAAVGNYGLVTLSGAKSFSAIDDVLAFRATGFYTERDGYVDNVATGDDDEIFDRDRWGGRLQALWTPTDTLSVLAIADYSEIDEVCCGTTVWRDNNRLDQRLGDTFMNPGSDALIEERGGTFIPESDIYEREVAYNLNPISQNEDSGLSVQVDWDFSDFHTLTSITAWRQFEAFDDIDADFTDLDGITNTRTADQEQFSQELRVAYTGDRWNYVAGAYYFTQDLDTTYTLTFGEDTEYLAGVFLGFPVEEIFQGGFFPPGGFAMDFNEQDHTAWAVFGQADFNLTDTIVLTAGLRYSDENKKLKATYIESGDEAGFTSGLFPPTTARPNVNEEIDDDQTTGTLKVAWFATDTIMTYASVSTGYKAGGTNTDRIDIAFDQVFGPETSTSYEIGMKAEWPEQGVRLNVALYQAEVDDLQVGTFTGTGYNVQNAAVADTYGGEVELTWQPTPNFNLTAGYAKAVADFDEFERGNCWVTTPFRNGVPDPGARNADGSLPANDLEAFNPAYCDRTGGRLGTNPEDFFVVMARQDWMISDSTMLWLKGEYTYTGDQMMGQNNDPLALQDSYQLVNLHLGLVFESMDLNLTLWGRNIFDEEYHGTSFPGTLQDGKEIAYVREPRTFGLSLWKGF
ncbi:MAG: TonB-dependent receptor [Pseudomonadota bacterium]